MHIGKESTTCVSEQAVGKGSVGLEWKDERNEGRRGEHKPEQSRASPVP